MQRDFTALKPSFSLNRAPPLARPFRRLWWALGAFLILQGLFLTIWPNLLTWTSTSSLSYRERVGMRSISSPGQNSQRSDWAQQIQNQITEGFRVQEQRLTEVAADLHGQIKEREASLNLLGVRLQEREDQLAKLQSQITDAAAGGRILTAGSGLVIQGAGNQDEEGGGSAARAGDSGSGVATISGAGETPTPPLNLPLKCNRLKDNGKKAKLTWIPQPGKYLLLMCSGGQLSNRLDCIRKHMLDATLLNRTLIFPSHGIDYDYEKLLDLDQPGICFGNSTFITLDKYYQMKGKEKNRHETTLKVARLICHVHTYQKPTICAALRQRYAPLGITFLSTDIPDFRTTGPWHKYYAREFLAKFDYDDDVIAFGNMFGVGGREHRFEGSHPLSVTPACGYYLTPSRPILQTAGGFVNSYLGTKYMAVHLRRGDFFQHCMMANGKGGKGKRACFQPIQQVAACLARRLDESPSLRSIYLSTNGNREEVVMLEKALALMKRPVPLVRMMSMVGAPWAAPLLKLKLGNDTEVIALVEKSICVLSAVFFGTAGSTFSADIRRLRDWWYLNTCKDGSICDPTEVADLLPMVMIK